MLPLMHRSRGVVAPMDMLTFLRRVLPPAGIYVAFTVINKNSVYQRFFDSLEELVAGCKLADSLGHDNYYAISSFLNRSSRKQKNVYQTKLIALDVDCVDDEEHTHKNQKDGLTALLKFISAVGLPKPTILSSGRGLHVYWIFETAVGPDIWQPVADALKNACIAQGFRVDPVVTADSARVLRPTETTNKKNHATVKILMDAPPVTPDAILKILQPQSKATTVLPMPAGTGTTGTVSRVLSNMSSKSSFEPAIAGMVYDKCAQVRWAVDHQKDVSEPMWYSLLGIAAHCIDPKDTAKAWSKEHPDYDEGITLRKLQQWKANTTGPATCNRFENDRPKGCKGCPIKGNIVSPAQIGVQYTAAAVADDAPDDIAKLVPMPKYFKRVTGKGIMHTIDGTDVDVCPFDIYPLGYGRDASLGYEIVRFKWKRAHIGWQDLMFRQALLNDEAREFATVIADQGIVLKGRKQVEGFRYMLRTYMDELRALRTMTNIHGSMGWKENFTQFVIGDRLYIRNDDGTVRVEDTSLTSAANRVGQNMYGMQGTVKEWRDATELLETADMPHHIFALNQTFAAPLWAFGGLKGVTVSLYGPTGSGKTLIQLWMQSVWGNPDRLHFSAKFTQNALFSRLGTYCNLPMTIDEATMMDDEDVGDFCYWVTQGRDKSRLNRNSEERDAKEWSTVVTVSTNKSLMSKMVASGLDTDAQMARLMEVPIPPHNLFAKSSAAGRTIYNFISTVYGYPGDAFVKALLRRGEVELRKLIAETTKSFGKMYDCHFIGNERYWEQNLIMQHVACQIALEEGIIGYDFTLGIKWAVSHLEGLRNAVQENQTNGFKLIHEYLNTHAAETLVIMHTDKAPSTVDHTRIPRGEVRARFDVYRPAANAPFDHGTVMLVQKSFKMWIAARGYDYNTVRNELRTARIDATPASKRTWLGRNTALKLGQHAVLGINLNNKEFKGYIEDIDQKASQLILGQIAVVK